MRLPCRARGIQAEPKKDAGGGKKPNALQRPLRPSVELAAVVGPEPLPRGEAVRKVWAYVEQHDLQNPANRREILADAKLEPVFEKTNLFRRYANG